MTEKYLVNFHYCTHTGSTNATDQQFFINCKIIEIPIALHCKVKQSEFAEFSTECTNEDSEKIMIFGLSSFELENLTNQISFFIKNKKVRRSNHCATGNCK